MQLTGMDKRIAIFFTLFALFLLAAGAFLNCPANAQGGIALSGTFSAQIFEIPQGSSVNASNVNIVVFNNDDNSIGINMSSQCPAGVIIILSESDFQLAPHSHKTISVAVVVTMDAFPGEHEMSITAEAYTTGVEGIQLLGSVSQTAHLKITGESGTVSIQALSPDGTSVPATIRLFKNVDSHKYEFAYSNTGALNAKVSPGSYIVEGYVGQQLLDQESFDIAVGETKTIDLTIGTIYFYYFGVLEYFNTDTGDLGYAEIQYTVRNVYEEVDDVSIMLEVSLNGEFLEQRMIDPPNTLTLDGAEGLYSYIPLDGWVPGDYSFKLILKMGDQEYTYSAEKQIDIADGNSDNGTSAKGSSNTPLIIGIACAVVVILAIAFFMIYKRRRTKNIRPSNKKTARRK